jgi:transposase
MASHQNEDVLRELYDEQGLTQKEIADELNVHSNTIRRWMKRHDISTGYSSGEASFSTTKDGYEEWQAWNPEREQPESVQVHRLVAVAQFGFDALRGNQVHHKTGIKWDNRPSNLTLETPSGHTSRHQEDWHTDVCPNCGYDLTSQEQG